MYILFEEFIFCTYNLNDWNYNKMINNPDVDPFNANKKSNACIIIYINIFFFRCNLSTYKGIFQF
jgi:hypothetical protein